MTEKEQEGWMTVKEAAEWLRLPRNRCYALINDGELPAVRLGERSIRLNRKEIEAFLAANRRLGSRA